MGRQTEGLDRWGDRQRGRADGETDRGVRQVRRQDDMNGVSIRLSTAVVSCLARVFHRILFSVCEHVCVCE